MHTLCRRQCWQYPCSQLFEEPHCLCRRQVCAADLVGQQDFVADRHAIVASVHHYR